jgi:hypothetical protein
MSGSLKGGLPRKRELVADVIARNRKPAVQRAKIDRDAVTAWVLVALAAAGWACYFLGTPQ